MIVQQSQQQLTFTTLIKYYNNAEVVNQFHPVGCEGTNNNFTFSLSLLQELFAKGLLTTIGIFNKTSFPSSVIPQLENMVPG